MTKHNKRNALSNPPASPPAKLTKDDTGGTPEDLDQQTATYEVSRQHQDRPQRPQTTTPSETQPPVQESTPQLPPPVPKRLEKLKPVASGFIESFLARLGDKLSAATVQELLDSWSEEQEEAYLDRHEVTPIQETTSQINSELLAEKELIGIMSIETNNRIEMLCTWFCGKKSKKLHQYSRLPRATLLDATNSINGALASSLSCFTTLKRYIEQGENFDKYVHSLENLKPVASVFIESLLARIGDRLSTVTVQELLDSWSEELEEAYAHLDSHEVAPMQDTTPQLNSESLDEKELISIMSIPTSDRIEMLCVWFCAKQSKKLNQYTRLRRTTLLDVANLIDGALSSSWLCFTILTRYIERGENFEEYVSSLKRLDSVASRIIECLLARLGKKLSAATVQELLNSWRKELVEAKDSLNRHTVLDPSSKSIFEEQYEKARKCNDPAFMEMINKILREIKNRNQAVNPFVFLCAPSGSGKSTFAYNLGSNIFPAIYLVYKGSILDREQEIYKPFNLISARLRYAIKKDVTMLSERPPNLMGFGTEALLCRVVNKITHDSNFDTLFGNKTDHTDIEEGREFIDKAKNAKGADFEDLYLKASEFSGAVTAEMTRIKMAKSVLERLLTFIAKNNLVFSDISAEGMIQFMKGKFAIATDFDGLFGKAANYDSLSVEEKFFVAQARLFDDNDLSMIAANSSAHSKAVLNEIRRINLVRLALKNLLTEMVINNLEYTMVNTEKMVEHLQLNDVSFETVYLIVEIFEQMLKAKNSETSWIQAQFSITDISVGALTLQEGKKRLEELGKEVPLVAFIDECILARDDKAKVRRLEAAEFVFLRSVLRIMKTIPFFSGTDATASNFCTQDSIVSGESDSSPIQCLVLNRLHGFNTALLRSRCQNLLEKFVGQAAVICPIIKFLETSYHHENPFLIELALLFLEGLGLNELKSGIEILNDLLAYICRQFMFRKKHPIEYSEAQFAYIMTYKWTRTHLLINKWNESCINRHLAHMEAIPHTKGAPYFYLGLVGKSQYYMYPEKKIAKGKEIFKTASIFTSFKDAPLTGMMLFGLDSRYSKPFISDATPAFPRLTTLDAVIRSFWNKKDMKMGTFLENVYTSAVMISSRANGLNDLDYAQFLGDLIRELSTARGSHPGAHPEREFPDKPPTVRLDQSVFGNKRIPLISPMAAPYWPRSATELLHAASEGKCNLGTFQFSTGNEIFDNVVFELNLEKCLLKRTVSGVDDYEEGESAGTIKTAAASVPKEVANEESGNTATNLKIETPYGSNVFNHMGRLFKVDRDLIKRIALIGECKQHQSNITLRYILEIIVKGKFEQLGKWNLLNDLGMTDCDLFQILTLKASDLTIVTDENATLLAEVNEKYHLWYLTKDGTDGNSFCLEQVPRQLLRKDNAKDVVILSLADINGDEFVDKLHLSKD